MFKVGDWVRHTYYNTVEKWDGTICETYHSDFDLWQPQEDEYCWLNKELVKITHINVYDSDKFYFIGVVNEDERKGYFSISELEPFIGTLPSFIKD